MLLEKWLKNTVISLQLQGRGGAEEFSSEIKLVLEFNPRE